MNWRAARTRCPSQEATGLCTGIVDTPSVPSESRGFEVANEPFTSDAEGSDHLEHLEQHQMGCDVSEPPRIWQEKGRAVRSPFSIRFSHPLQTSMAHVPMSDERVRF